MMQSLSGVAPTVVAETPAPGDLSHLCDGIPNCTVQLPPGFSDPGLPAVFPGDLTSGGFGIPGWFVGLFVMVLAVGIGLTVWRVTAARRMAARAGLNQGDATAVALLDDNGLGAAYLASSLQPPRDAAPAPASPVPGGPPPAAGRSAAERLAELKNLHETGAITADEYAAKRQQILDGI